MGMSGARKVCECVRCDTPSFLTLMDYSQTFVGGEVTKLRRGYICWDVDRCLEVARKNGRELRVFDPMPEKAKEPKRPALRLIQGGLAGT